MSTRSVLFIPAHPAIQMVRRLDIRIVNICVVDKHDRGFEEAETQHAKTLEIFHAGRRSSYTHSIDKTSSNGFRGLNSK